MKRLILLAMGALALLATTAAPAGAGATATTASSAVCLEASEFSSLAALTASASTARGWNRDAPARVNVGDSDYDSGIAPNVPPGFTVTIPTYIHVLTDGNTGRLTNAQIRRQMDVLNLSFAGFYGGANSGVSFELAGVTRTDNADWFTMNDFADEIEAKTALRQGGPNALNIYTGTAAGNLGFAYYPSILKLNGGKFAILDGVVIHYGSVPGGFIDNFNLGYTATHEVGHWLGLAHTFDKGCLGRRRPRRRHAGDVGADERLPGGQGHLREGGRARPDPQLHGLLGRPLLHPVHAGPGRTDAGSVHPLPHRPLLGTETRGEGPPRPLSTSGPGTDVAAKRRVRDMRDGKHVRTSPLHSVLSRRP